MPASLKLDEATGNKERYAINITIKAGHREIKGEATCRASVLSNGSNIACPAGFTPGRPDASTLDDDLLAEILAKVDADKPTGSTIDTAYPIQAEYWMADGHAAIEDEVRKIAEKQVQVSGAYAKYSVSLPKDGPVAARTESRTSKIWKPSDAVKAALLTEADAAVTSMMSA